MLTSGQRDNPTRDTKEPVMPDNKQRDDLVALAKRMLAFHESGTTEQAATNYRVPAANYIDPARWQLEMDRIFRRVPLPLALTCEIREPNSYKALDALAVP